MTSRPTSATPTWTRAGSGSAAAGRRTRCRSASRTRTGFPTAAGWTSWTTSWIGRPAPFAPGRWWPTGIALFTPGMFARVRLIGSGVRRVTLIPEVAVSTDQDRKFVFVLNPDSTVAYRSVTLGRQVDGQRRIIRDGAQAGRAGGGERIRPDPSRESRSRPRCRLPTRPTSAAAAPADSGSAP